MKQDDGSFRSISVAKDGYVQNPGVGYILLTYYSYKEAVEKLIFRGNLDTLTSKPMHDTDSIGLSVKESIEDLVQYCIEKSIDYIYVFENKKWSWIKISKDVSIADFEELDLTNTLEYADRNMVDKPRWCSYRTAVRWGDTSLVLLNNIMDIDKDFDPYENFYEEEDDEYYPEFYQYYITDMSDDSVEWSRKVFPDITYVYSELLSAWILCVAHYGTSWDYVPTQYIGHINIPKDEFDRFNKQED
jgi:hypothetical protein